MYASLIHSLELYTSHSLVNGKNNINIIILNYSKPETITSETLGDGAVVESNWNEVRKL